MRNNLSILFRVFLIGIIIYISTYCLLLIGQILKGEQREEKEILVVNLIGSICLVLQCSLCAIVSKSNNLRVCWIVWIMNCAIFSFLLSDSSRDSVWLVFTSALFVTLWTLKTTAQVLH